MTIELLPILDKSEQMNELGETPDDLSSMSRKRRLE
jgi:hypothetical protein